MSSVYFFLAFLSGLWSRPNAVDSQPRRNRVVSILVFGPISFFVGYYWAKSLEISIYFSIVPGGVGFIVSKPLEYVIRKKLGSGDGPCAAWLLKLAEKDGDELRKAFIDQAIVIRQLSESKEPVVDELITAYNSARQLHGLAPIEDLKERIPYV